MCGIVGIVRRGPANQEVYDSLLLLQHRGQDSTGIATADGGVLPHARRRRARCVRRSARATCASCSATIGLGHVRYATKRHGVERRRGAALLRQCAVRHRARPQRQPHEHARAHRRALPQVTAVTSTPSSDTELLVNVLANELQSTISGVELDPEQVFQAVAPRARARRGLVRRDRADRRLRAARLPRPVRHPSAHPRHAARPRTAAYEWIVASESLVLENGEFEVVRDVDPGEAVFIDLDGHLHTEQCAADPKLVPCSFEYVYLARPDSIMNGISVYDARLRLGDRLADTIAQVHAQGGDRRRHADPRFVAARGDAGRAEARHSSTARASTRTATSAGRSSCRARRCARSSVRQKLNAMSQRVQGQERAARSTTRSCAGRPRRRSSRWRGMPGPRASRSRQRRPARALPARVRHQHAHPAGARRPRADDPRDRRGARRRLHGLPGGRGPEGRDPRGLGCRGPRHELLRRPSTSPAR